MGNLLIIGIRRSKEAHRAYFSSYLRTSQLGNTVMASRRREKRRGI